MMAYSCDMPSADAITGINVQYRPAPRHAPFKTDVKELFKKMREDTDET
jgi:hypothetical protein